MSSVSGLRPRPISLLSRSTKPTLTRNTEAGSGRAQREKKYQSTAWRLLGGEDLNSLPARELGRVMRAFGKNPSEQDIQYLKYNKGLDDGSRLMYDEYLGLYGECTPGLKSADQLIQAFKVFDKDKAGQIKSADLRDVLTRLGEPLSHDEVDRMFRTADIDGSGVIKYEDFARFIMADNRSSSKL